ncbi:MAG: ABC transporter ATP-binding protein, partial [Chthoniobacteraceae bacterium]
MPIYRRVIGYYRPFLGPTVVGVALTLVSTGFNLLKPWPLKYIIDGVLLAGSGAAGHISAFGYELAGWSVTDILLMLCGLMVVFHLVGGLLGLYTTMIFVRVGLQSLLRLRTELYAYLHSLPLKFHDQRRSADSSFRVAYDSQSIQSFYSKGTFIFQSVLTLVSTFAILWGIDAQLALLSLTVVPFMIAAIYLYSKRIRTQSTEIQERESALLTVAQEGLSSVRMVQAFGREAFEVAQFQKSAHGSLEANLQLTATSMKSSLVVSTIMAISTAAVYYLGARHVIDGQLKPGDLWVISAYLMMLYSPLEALTNLAWALEGSAAAATRCFEVLDKENEVREPAHPKKITACRGAIAFENVAFGYTPERMILRGVNLRIEP